MPKKKQQQKKYNKTISGKVDIKPSSFRQRPRGKKVKDIWQKEGICWILFFSSSCYIWALVIHYFTHGNKTKIRFYSCEGNWSC